MISHRFTMGVYVVKSNGERETVIPTRPVAPAKVAIESARWPLCECPSCAGQRRP